MAVTKADKAYEAAMSTFNQARWGHIDSDNAEETFQASRLAALSVFEAASAWAKLNGALVHSRWFSDNASRDLISANID